MTDTQTVEDPRLVALKPLMDAVRKNIQDYQALNSQVAAAEGDRETAIKSWMEGSSDPEATAIREAIERANAKLRTLAEANVQDSTLTDEEKFKLKAELENRTKKLKASSRALRGLAEPFDLDVTPILREMGDPFLPKEATGTGSGLPRPSVYVQCIRNHDEAKQSMTFENLSGAAKHMDIPVEDLGKLYAKAAGVAYEEVAQVKTPQEFEWKNESLKNAPHWTIKTTPKESARRGRQPVSTSTQGQGEPASNEEDAA